jgi:hypothetical protein
VLGKRIKLRVRSTKVLEMDLIESI